LFPIDLLFEVAIWCVVMELARIVVGSVYWGYSEGRMIIRG